MRLGLRVVATTAQLRKTLGIRAKKGALVLEVEPGGPAAKGGVQAGDVLAWPPSHSRRRAGGTCGWAGGGSPCRRSGRRTTPNGFRPRARSRTGSPRSPRQLEPVEPRGVLADDAGELGV